MSERDPHLHHILDLIPIVDHISRYERLKPEGKQYVGIHNHSDSKGKRCLKIDPDTQLWYCFHCGVGGTAFDYEMDRQGISFWETVEFLCNLYTIDLPKLTPEQREHIKRDSAEHEAAHAVIIDAFRFYHEVCLFPDHRCYYHKERKLSDETIDENLLGYAPAGGRVLVEHLGKKYPDRDLLLKTGLFFLREKDGKLHDRYQDRYVIPYWYRGKIVYSIGRSLNPKIEAHKKYVKHLNHSSYPYVSPIAIRHILWGEDSIQKGKPILVAEGIFDALLAKQELASDYAVISPVTARIANAQIERIANVAKQKGAREIIFLPDSEASRAGEEGALTTAQRIRSSWQEQAKAQVKSGGKTQEEIEKEWIPALKIATLPRPPELDKIDLADYLAQGKVHEVRYWIEAARTLARFEQYISGNPNRFFHGRSFVPKYMADELRTEGQYFLYTAEQLYRYQAGVYIADENGTARVIQAKLKDRSRDVRINETLKHLNIASSGIKPVEVNPDNGVLNLKNGILDLVTGDFKKHTPDFYNTIRIPVIYDKSVRCPRIDTFFREVLPPDCLELIEEMFSYCLIQTTRFQRAFMLTGTGSNGKSTLLNLLTAFLGSDNVAKIPLQELDENRFKRAELFGKLANVFADLDSHALQRSTYFKTITTGDDIDAERKHKNPFSFRPFCKLIFSANEIPKSSDRSFAYYRRWIIIPFPNTFEGQNDNKDLIDELTSSEELSGFLNLALQGLERLTLNQQFSENKTTHEALDQYKTANDNVKEFLEECCTVEMVTKTPRTNVFGRYKNFCEISEYRTVSQIKFNARLMELYQQVEKTRDTDPKRTRIWQNLKLVD